MLTSMIYLPNFIILSMEESQDDYRFLNSTDIFIATGGGVIFFHIRRMFVLTRNKCLAVVRQALLYI